MRAVWMLALMLLAGCLQAGPAGDDGAEAPTGIVIDDDAAGVPVDNADARGEAPRSSDATTSDATGATPVRSKRVSDEAYPWEPSGAVDPTDPDHYVLAYRSADHPTMTVRTTFDAGQTWQKSLVPIGADATGPAADWTYNGDAVVFFAPDGTLYVGGLGRTIEHLADGSSYVQHGSNIFVVRSPDGGLTFDDAVVVAVGSGTSTHAPANTRYSDNYVNHDRPWFSAGANGVMIAAWNKLGHDGAYPTVAGASPIPYDGNEFQYAISRDGGMTWTDPETLTHGGWPGALVRSDGSFALGHSSHMNGKLTVYSSDDGTQWSGQELGTGVDAAMLTEYDGDLLVATTGVLQGKRLPAYYRIGEETTGPWMFATGQDLNPYTHIQTDPSGGFWATWHGQNGTLNLARFEDSNAPWPTERHVLAQIDPQLQLYGDYVYTLGVSEHLYMVWNDVEGNDRQLYVSVY